MAMRFREFRLGELCSKSRLLGQLLFLLSTSLITLSAASAGETQIAENFVLLD